MPALTRQDKGGRHGAGPKDYLHDEVSTDKRNPRVNANGLIYGATEESTDLFPVLDPVNHRAAQVKMLVRDPATPSSKNNPMTPSPYWVSSNIFRFSHPMTPLCGPPALVQSVWLASSAKTRWWVGKQVLISVIFPVVGSYINRCRFADSIGVSFAEG